MGRSQKPADTESDAEREQHGMGLSSEHDEGEVQEVDSREQD